MNILVTGGTGFIGQALIPYLKNQQHQIIVLSRNIKTAQQKLGSMCKIIQSLSEINDAHIDAIINLAGEPLQAKRWSVKQKHVIIQSRVQTTEKIVTWCANKKQKPSILISGSAIGFYGNQGSEILSENAQPVVEFAHELCLAWEQAAEKMPDDTRVCLLRTGIVLGTQGGALSQMLLPFSLGLGCTFGSGQQYLSWIHLDDMVKAIVFLLTKQHISGPVNATAPNPVTNQQFCKTLAKTLHRPLLFNVPAWLLRSILGEVSHLLLTGQRVTPNVLLHNKFQFQYTQLSMALENLLY